MTPLKTALLAAAAAVAAATSAQAADFKTKSAGDILVRGRALAVVPQESGDVTAPGLGLGKIGTASVGNAYVPELDFTYFITDNVAAELILGTTRHSVKAKTASGVVDVGKVSLLPPTLTLQYHFMPKERVSPYVGAGLNYTLFYNEKGANGFTTDYKNAFGVALQAGVDVALTGAWSLNLDVKKLFVKTDLSVNGGAITSKARLDPWIVGVGVGYRF